jgi:inosine triphosphate pyrophosphatase
LHAQPAWNALTLIWKTPGITDVMDQLFDAACQDNAHADPSTLALPDPTIVDLLSPIRTKSSLAQDEIESSGPLKRQKIIEQTITFVTGNKKKLEEVKRILSNGSELGFKVTNVKLDLPELQGKDPLEIAREKCALAAQHVGGAVITEDTSLCFSALGNLPGPYIKWFLETCGHNGLNNMIHFSKDKSGYAQTVVAFTTGPNEEVYLFDGQTKGTIVLPRGSLDFGWDPIFQPDEGGGLTYAEMSKDEKDSISHRSRAFSQLRDYLIQNELSINANLK